MSTVKEHPAFTRAKALPASVRSYFPTSPEEAAKWEQRMLHRALSMTVLAVAVPRIECAWAAYCDSVEGRDHMQERGEVARTGEKLPEAIARAIFHFFDDVPYAE